MDAVSNRPWELPGPNNSPRRECDRALERLHRADDRPPTDDDRPSCSTFPMTRGAREALRLERERRRA